MPCDQNHLVEVFNRTRGRCLYCGRDLAFHAHRVYSERGAWVVDRFIPVSKGGEDSPKNWTACCLACSHQKGEQLPWDFSPERFRDDVWELDAYIDWADTGGEQPTSR